MAQPTGPIDIPDAALQALESLRVAWANQLTDAKFGVGLKQVNGDFTDEVSLVVFVPNKVPANQLPIDQVIPATWQAPDGTVYSTDVVESNPQPIALLNDNAVYSPFLGGVEIGWDELLSPGGGLVNTHIGTMGCIVQQRSNGSRQYLTARHVVGAVGNDISHAAPHAPVSSVIGSVSAVGNPWDCAVIEPNDPARFELLGIQDLGSVAGSTTFQLWGVAKKRGRTTGLTSGVVVAYIPDPNGVGFERLRLTTFPFGGLFAWHGDSGSAVVDGSNRVFGLLVEADDIVLDSNGDPVSASGMAIPIQRVLDSLQVEIATPPTVNSVNPNTAAGVLLNGGTTQIDGSGFDSGSSVQFNGVAALAVVPASPLRLIVTPPIQPPGTTGDVTVTTSHGDTSVSHPEDEFSY